MTDPTAPTRDDLAGWYRDDVQMAAAEFLGVLHDIDFHHYTTDGASLDYYGDDIADVVLALVERSQRAALRAHEKIGAATACKDWVLSGRPLRCGTCGNPIDPTYEPWQVCDSHAEHDTCHHDDHATEVQRRTWTREDDEHQAHLDDRTRTGPRTGDRVRLTYPDCSTHDGTWLCDCHHHVRVDIPGQDRTGDGRIERDVTTRATVEVTELAEDRQ